jgi:16S rRNA (cytosine967-C5)-methyltransferase
LYATCSLEPEENEEVIEAVLETDPTLEPDFLAADLLLGSESRKDSPTAYQRYWWPHQTGCDGFFGARLRKRGDNP